MQKRQLKFGWGWSWSVVLVWAFGLAAIMMSYQNTEKEMERVERLGTHIEEFRSHLFFDSPYRIDLASQQIINLDDIEAMHKELATADQGAGFMPDIQQLLFTTEWFVEQSRAFMGTELALVALIDEIQAKRLVYAGNQERQAHYYQLSAYVFEALFASQSANSVAYRDFENLYKQSLLLPEDEKKQLQALLAKTSQVMGNYAQGSYFVSQLISHSVHNEITEVETQYHHLLEKYLFVMMVLSGAALLSIMLLWYSSYAMLQRSSSLDDNANAVGDDNAAEVESKPISSAKSEGVHTQHPPHTAVVEDRAKYDSAKNDSAKSDSAVTHVDDISPIAPPSHEPNDDLTATIVQTETAQAEINFSGMLESLGNDSESLCMLLEVFIEDHQNDVTDISRLIHDSPEEAIRKAHSLKGVGGNLGAMNLRDVAGQLEHAIQHDSTRVPELLVALNKHLSKATNEAQSFIHEKA
ncbi:Hpt domain-containing protein [Vibrio renipiscarius]|uniref:HPt domain-containing protein n=1 Tax=Vibrio renipiscarius TaxID=1461322 RepID=A0A0C2KCI2_9VIBR|nr:Hpt domain-containing protein [Vibrio renipiscarius]KII79788.1 hypothetical protein PL18_09090 [Vibrio renipiscarius]KII80585.1 hypothetical protein OJ16_04575 [Vibrio renipiscarius]